MPFRKITNKGGVRVYVGIHQSFILNKPIWYEGHLARDYLKLLEFDYADVMDIKGEACRFYYPENGKRRRYTSDFLVTRRLKKQVVEVKPKAKALSEEYKMRFAVADELCRREGLEFILVTEAIIYQQPRFDTVSRLLHYQRVPVYPQHQILCEEFFADKSEVALGEVADFFQMKGIGQQVVFALLRWGILNINLDTPLTPEALITLPRPNAPTASRSIE
jgi:hypothetical protein